MNFQEFLSRYDKIKKGAFIKCVYISEQNGYLKITTTTTRLVNYYHIKSVQEKIAKGEIVISSEENPNIEIIIPHILTHNKKTNNMLVHLYICPKGKTERIYKNPNGEIISKEEYEKAVPPKKKYGKGQPVVYQVKLENLVSIG